MARKKAHDEGHENAERWLLTYADLITLLMVFFVVMFAMSNSDKAKFDQLSVSLKQAFRVDVLRGYNPTSLHGDGGAAPLTAAIQEAIWASPDSRMVSTLSELQDAMQRLPQPDGTSRTIEVGTARDGVVISMSGGSLFDSGRADLKSDGVTLLDALAPRLREMPNEVRIEGHTDNVPISTALFPSNWELSSARATTVARRMVEYGWVKANRVIAAGYGDARPMASNDTREGRTRNRRVDIVIIASQAQSQAAVGTLSGIPVPGSIPGLPRPSSAPVTTASEGHP